MYVLSCFSCAISLFIHFQNAGASSYVSKGGQKTAQKVVSQSYRRKGIDVNTYNDEASCFTIDTVNADHGQKHTGDKKRKTVPKTKPEINRLSSAKALAGTTKKAGKNGKNGKNDAGASLERSVSPSDRSVLSDVQASDDDDDEAATVSKKHPASSKSRPKSTQAKSGAASAHETAPEYSGSKDRGADRGDHALKATAKRPSNGVRATNKGEASSEEKESELN